MNKNRIYLVANLGLSAARFTALNRTVLYKEYSPGIQLNIVLS